MIYWLRYFLFGRMISSKLISIVIWNSSNVYFICILSAIIYFVDNYFQLRNLFCIYQIIFNSKKKEISFKALLKSVVKIYLMVSISLYQGYIDCLLPPMARRHWTSKRWVYSSKCWFSEVREGLRIIGVENGYSETTNAFRGIESRRGLDRWRPCWTGARIQSKRWWCNNYLLQTSCIDV